MVQRIQISEKVKINLVMKSIDNYSWMKQIVEVLMIVNKKQIAGYHQQRNDNGVLQDWNIDHLFDHFVQEVLLEEGNE